MNSPNPIQRFLGLVRTTDSPFVLLGVTRGVCDERAIRSALLHRLDRIAHHPEAQSHEADEVRLALHVAAAQLLDPVVRENLEAFESSRDGLPSSDHLSHVGFREIAKRVLARSGGWGKESQRWLALLAHAHGLNQSQLHAELRAIGAGSHAGSGSTPILSQPTRSVPLAASSRSVYEEIHAPRRRPHRALSIPAVWLIGSATVLIIIAAAVTLRGALGRPTPSSEQSMLTEGAPTTNAGGVSPGTRDREIPIADETDPLGERIQFRSPAAVIRWLVLAQQEHDENPGEAAWRFERAVAAFATTWTTFSDGDRARANDYVVEVLHRFAVTSGNGQRAFGAIINPAKVALIGSEPVTPDSVRAAIWSVAIVSMLATNPDTASPVRRAANATLSQIGAATTGQRGSFEEHARDAMPIIAQRLAGRTEHPSTSTLEGWIAWVDIIDRVVREIDDPTARGTSDRLILDAADRLLHSQGHPGAAPVARDAFELLLSRVSWSAATPTPPAWGSLLGWFDELDIDTRDLAVATEWLAKQQITPRPSSDMVLSRSATLDGRSTLRDRYARLWGRALAADTLGFATVWGRAVRQTLAHFQKRSPSDRLARAAAMSRLSEAAALRWRGDASDARAIILDPAAPINAALLQPDIAQGKVRSVDLGRDGQWTVRYLSSPRQDVETRSRLLVQLGRHSGPLGPIDADVVVQAALRGASSELRTRATQVVKRRAAEPGVISAVLDAVSQAPKNRLTTTLIGEITGRKLPPPADPTWTVKVRLALIDRLLTLLGESDESSAIDRLSVEFARSYATRLGAVTPASGVEAFGDEQLTPDLSLRLTTHTDWHEKLWMKWQEQAQLQAPYRRAPVSIATILRHHNGRIQLADGPMQRFAATQVSIAEAMALVITAERPSRASDIQLVIEHMAAQRRSAPTILDQIIAAERAMLQLWGIRFGLMLSEVDPPAVSLNTASPVEERL